MGGVNLEYIAIPSRISFYLLQDCYSSFVEGTSVLDSEKSFQGSFGHPEGHDFFDLYQRLPKWLQVQRCPDHMIYCQNSFTGDYNKDSIDIT